MSSIDLRAGFLHRFRPLGHFGGKKRRERIRVVKRRVRALANHLAANVGRLESGLECIRQFRNDVFGRAGGRENAVEADYLEILQTDFDKRRHLGQGRIACAAGHRERPHAALFRVLRCLRNRSGNEPVSPAQALLAYEQAAHRRYRQPHRQALVGKRFEFVAPIETAGPLVFCFDEHGNQANPIGNLATTR